MVSSVYSAKGGGAKTFETHCFSSLHHPLLLLDKSTPKGAAKKHGSFYTMLRYLCQDKKDRNTALI